jgi:hypothetical protein
MSGNATPERAKFGVRHLGPKPAVAMIATPKSERLRFAVGFAALLRAKASILDFGPKALFAMVAVPKDKSPFTGFLILLPPCAASHWWLLSSHKCNTLATSALCNHL